MKVPYFKPWITNNDKRIVVKAMTQRWLTNGPYLQKFEKKFSQYIGTKYSSGVGSATHALHLALRSLNVSVGDEVIVPTFTFTATANTVKYCGGEPILVDVDCDTFNISPSVIKKNIHKKTKGIIVVHYGGQSCDMDEILQIAKEKNLFIIEDCAHALGSTYKSLKCGNIGHAGCFSFYPTKIITTGEGGMVTTNDATIYKKVTLLKSQAMSITSNERENKAIWKYDIVDLGYNYRLDEIRSSLGLSQLGRVDQINKKRISIAKKYDRLLKKIKGITVPKVGNTRNHIYHLYTIKVEKSYRMTRDELFKKLYDNNIGASVQYYPLHLMSLFKNTYKTKKNTFKNANKLKDQVLSLPIYPQMSTKQVEYVVSKLL